MREKQDKAFGVTERRWKHEERMRGLEGWDRSGAGGAGANGNFVMNRPRHHRQNLFGNFGHVMRGGDVIHSLSENFFFGIAASFKPTARNEVMTEKNFCHWGTP